jgi:putative oxidoreductase
MRKYIFLEIIVAALILLFLYTVTAKLIDFKGFAADLRNQPFPNSLVQFLVWIFPSLELLIVLAMLFEKSRLAGFGISFVLMSLFTIYTAAVLLHFFPRTPCSCGGVIKKLSWSQHLALNIFYTGISWLGMRLQLKKQKQITNLKFSL